MPELPEIGSGEGCVSAEVFRAGNEKVSKFSAFLTFLPQWLKTSQLEHYFVKILAKFMLLVVTPAK